ncbi:hypothetical protein V9T40_013083 [Parthenolecanium corni]|uniref:Uncharacterized protein n=1 Tax=Parthenolecanium corni TaxID=536013 RepID=A0AAN9Y4U1_9HEMI
MAWSDVTWRGLAWLDVVRRRVASSVHRRQIGRSGEKKARVSERRIYLADGDSADDAMYAKCRGVEFTGDGGRIKKRQQQRERVWRGERKTDGKADKQPVVPSKGNSLISDGCVASSTRWAITGRKEGNKRLVAAINNQQPTQCRYIRQTNNAVPI